MSILQIKYDDTKLLETEKCIDEEFTAAFRKVSRLPPNFVQHWINTGYLPSQYYIGNTVNSDTGSSLSEEESIDKQNVICNTVLKYKLNDKQQCNNTWSNSSVDTAAYVLSNTNTTKKENLYPKFFKKDGILKIHKVINYANNKTDTAANVYDTINSNTFNKTSAFDIYNSYKMYPKNPELGERNITEGIESNLPTCKETIDNMCKDENQIIEGNLNCQSTEFVENSIESTNNITNVNKNNSFFDGSHNDSARQIRQKKLYVGRDSPIDIRMSIMSAPADIEISEEKRNLHPAYRSSPVLQKSHKKCIPKKRKYKFFFKSSRNKSQEDTSSNSSKDDDTDVEKHDTKRLKSLDDFENNDDEKQFFSTISQTSEKDKLRQSCKEMEKQIKRFPTSKFILTNELKQLRHDHISQGNTTLNNRNLRHSYVLKSPKKIKRKVTQNKINATTVSCNTLSKKSKPIVLLERLSEKMIEHYIYKKDLQPEEKRRKSAPLKNMTKNTNKRNLRSYSIKARDTKPHLRLKNVVVDSGSSNASTIIIYNHMDTESTSKRVHNDSAIIKLNSTSLSSSDNAEKKKLEKISSDIKLIDMRPVVVLERLQTIEPSTKEHLRKSNYLQNKWQPAVVLEQFINANGNACHNLDSSICNELNKTIESKIESMKTNKTDDNYEHSKKLLCFKTKIYSDTDSDESSTDFNLNISMKYNIKNKTLNRKSVKSLKMNMSEDFKSTDCRKTNISKAYTKNKNPVDKHMSVTSCTDKEDNQLYKFNKSGDNQRVHAPPNMKLLSDTPEKDKGIIKNSVKGAVIIDTNKNNKSNTLVFITKAYDSDSE